MTAHRSIDTLGIGYDTPDFGYLRDVTPPRPQVFEGDSVVGHELGMHVEVLPRLGPEDGIILTPGGKVRSTGVASGSEGLNAQTGNFKAVGNGQPERTPAQPHEMTPATVALRTTVKPVGEIYYSRSTTGPRHRHQPRHRA